MKGRAAAGQGRPWPVRCGHEVPRGLSGHAFPGARAGDGFVLRVRLLRYDSVPRRACPHRAEGWPGDGRLSGCHAGHGLARGLRPKRGRLAGGPLGRLRAPRLHRRPHDLGGPAWGRQRRPRPALLARASEPGRRHQYRCARRRAVTGHPGREHHRTRDHDWHRGLCAVVGGCLPRL